MLITSSLLWSRRWLLGSLSLLGHNLTKEDLILERGSSSYSMFHGLRTQTCPRIPRGMRRADKICCMWAVPPARTTNSPTTGTAATFTSTLDDQPSSDRSHLFRDIPFSRLSCPIPKCPYKLLTLACGHHYMCSCFLKATHVNTFIPYCSHRQAPHLCESG